MPKVNDLTGQRFGKLTVIRKTDERIKGRIVWECRCDCGNTALVSGDRLRSGHTQSCGCAKSRIKDITGQRFGKLVAIRPTDERRHEGVVWECQCDCGNTAFVDVNHLQSGQTQSCGCIRAIDLTGQRFGRLTAVRKMDERRGTSVVWECKCDCGNIAYVATSNLRNGTTASCGCTRSIDLTGQRFGLLTAVRKTDKRQGSSVVWECKCDCGNVAFVPAYYLRCGRVQSCGCMRYKRKSKKP